MWQLIAVLLLVLVGSSQLEGMTGSVVATQAGTLANMRESVDELHNGPLSKLTALMTDVDATKTNIYRLQSTLVPLKAAKVPGGYA